MLFKTYKKNASNYETLRAVNPSNYETLYSYVETNDFMDLQSEINNATAEEIAVFLQWKNPEDNNNTALHVAFGDENKTMIQTLINGQNPLSASQITSVISVQNDGGISPIGKIFEEVGALAQVNAFQKIMEGFNTPDKKKAVLLSYGNNNETLLHLEVEFDLYEDALVDIILSTAVNNKFLKDVLRAKNLQDDSPVHSAILEANTDILLKCLSQARSNGIINDILIFQGENNNTIAHLGFENENTTIQNAVIDSIATLGNLEITNLLKSENTGGIKVIAKMLDNQNFISMFERFGSQKEIVLYSIINEVLSITELQAITLDADKIALKTKIQDLYTAVSSDNTLLTVFYLVVDLDAAVNSEYLITDFFSDSIITEKLGAVEEEMVDFISNLSGDDITVDAIYTKRLAKIDTYKTAFSDKLPDNFGDNIEAAVTDKLADMVTNEEARINITTDEDSLSQAYFDADNKIELYLSVYTALGTDTTEAKNSVANVTVLKAGRIVDNSGKCLANENDYLTISQAQECMNLIDSFRNSVVLGTVVGSLFQDTAYINASDFITSKALTPDDIKRGLDKTFYVAKDVIVQKDVQRYIDETNIDTKLTWVPSSRKIMQKLFSEIAGELRPGLDRIQDYNRQYTDDALGKAHKPNIFVNNVSKQLYQEKVAENEQVSLESACAEFKVTSGLCGHSEILSMVQMHICSTLPNMEFDGLNATLLLCNSDIQNNGIDSLSYDSTILSTLNYIA